MESMFIITVVTLALMCWLNYSMAEKRNRNGVAWAVISCLTIPIGGTLLLLLLGDATKDKEDVE